MPGRGRRGVVRGRSDRSGGCGVRAVGCRGRVAGRRRRRPLRRGRRRVARFADRHRVRVGLDETRGGGPGLRRPARRHGRCGGGYRGELPVGRPDGRRAPRRGDRPMSAVSIELVRGWRPESLSVAAGDVATAQKRVDREVQAMRRALDAATRSWEGPAAQAAADRAAREAATGFKLADALDAARAALETGAADIGGARSRLLATLGGAEAQGFAVSGDGSVTAPTLPPVMTSPDDAAAAIDERNAEQQRLNDQASSLASDIGRALQSVDDADRRTADTLTGIQIPQTLESAVRAYLERARTSRDLLGALGAYGAGGVALALQLKKAVGIFGKTGAYARFLKHASAPISDYQTLLRNFAGADDALREFSLGKANGGFARFLVGTRAARLAGRAFLPLTVATGALDAVTGGGYDGARGWATRGFGLAGAAGAGTLLLAGPPPAP